MSELNVFITFNELAKHCDYLMNEWKESQQKFQRQSEQFQEVKEKLNEKEIV